MTDWEESKPALRVLMDVAHERSRQDMLKAEGRFDSTCADSISNLERFAILSEEIGEVVRECMTQPTTAIAHDTTGSPEGLRKELVQVAAIATAWIEGLDREAEERAINTVSYRPWWMS